MAGMKQFTRVFTKQIVHIADKNYTRSSVLDVIQALIYLGETVILELGSNSLPFRSSLTAAKGQMKPFHKMRVARGTSMMISFSVGFLVLLT
jgi:hypothetical protein